MGGGLGNFFFFFFQRFSGRGFGFFPSFSSSSSFLPLFFFSPFLSLFFFFFQEFGGYGFGFFSLFFFLLFFSSFSVHRLGLAFPSFSAFFVSFLLPPLFSVSLPQIHPFLLFFFFLFFFSFFFFFFFFFFSGGRFVCCEKKNWPRVTYGCRLCACVRVLGRPAAPKAAGQPYLRDLFPPPPPPPPPPMVSCAPRNAMPCARVCVLTFPSIFPLSCLFLFLLLFFFFFFFFSFFSHPLD